MSGDRFPPGACDTHMHVYDARYPIAPTTVLQPPDATIDAYRRVQTELGLRRVVVVQPTTYGLDNSCQLDAVAEFGDNARAIVVVDDTTSDAELERLHALGARGARFHMLPGGAVPWGTMATVARRVAPLGWHIQLQMDGNLLPDRLADLNALPTRLVVDHVGRFMPPPPPDDARFRSLIALVDAGSCWVKLSAPYESTLDGAPDYPRVADLAHALVEHAPERVLWATNWPHPGQADPPDIDDLRRLAFDWLPTPDLRRRALVDNPVELYGFAPVP